jgi:hypothetical protein
MNGMDVGALSYLPKKNHSPHYLPTKKNHSPYYQIKLQMQCFDVVLFIHVYAAPNKVGALT